MNMARDTIQSRFRLITASERDREELNNIILSIKKNLSTQISNGLPIYAFAVSKPFC
jgi:hypothetical protein